MSKYSIFYLTFNILHTSVGEKLLKTNRLHTLHLPLQFGKTEGKLIKVLKVGIRELRKRQKKNIIPFSAFLNIFPGKF